MWKENKAALTGSIFGLMFDFPLSLSNQAIMATGGCTVGIVPCLLSLYLSLKIRAQINEKYASEPLKQMPANFFLFASHIIFYDLMAKAALASILTCSLTPFTLPVMIAIGTSGMIILGLYLLTRPVVTPKPANIKIVVHTREQQLRIRDSKPLDSNQLNNEMRNWGQEEDQQPPASLGNNRHMKFAPPGRGRQHRSSYAAPVSTVFATPTSYELSTDPIFILPPLCF